jgi:DNA-binding CsgD family transcriptional regulator
MTAEQAPALARFVPLKSCDTSALRWERWIPEWVRRLGMAVWVTGPGQRLVYVNERAERLLGVVAREAVGRACPGVVAARTPAGAPFCGARCPMNAAAEGDCEVEPAQVRIGARPGRDDHWVRMTVIPVDGPDRSGRWMVHTASVEDRAHRLEQHALRLAGRSDAIRAIDGPRARRPLTAREQEVLDLLADDVEVGRIAARLGLSHATARNHVQHLLAKLGAHSVEEAVAMRLLAE